MKYLKPVKSPFCHPQLLVATVLASALTTILTGCGGTSTTSNTQPPPVANPGVTFSGTVNAGTQSLVGATIQVYAVGTTGNGSAGTALLTAALTTDSNGAFTVPANYPCPAAASQLYVTARGGHLGTAAANSAAALIASIGACNQVVASSHIVVNEVTTVATAWAFSQFMASGGNIGASSTNTIGIANAAATAASLANPLAGTSPGTTFPSNGASPAAKINTLANIIHTCISSASSTTAACASLLSSTTGFPGLSPPEPGHAGRNPPHR